MNFEERGEKKYLQVTEVAFLFLPVLSACSFSICFEMVPLSEQHSAELFEWDCSLVLQGDTHQRLCC